MFQTHDVTFNVITDWLTDCNIWLVHQQQACINHKIFNHLPDYIKDLINEKQVFKKTLERFLLDNICYSIDEYLNYSNGNIDNHSS